MPGLQRQIISLFNDVEPEIKEVVVDVLLVEQELIHMDRPRGVMERIDNILDRAARHSLQDEEKDEN